MALILFLDTSAATDRSCCVKPADFLNSSKLFRSFLWFLPKIYFFSNSSTASVNSLPVFG